MFYKKRYTEEFDLREKYYCNPHRERVQDLNRIHKPYQVDNADISCPNTLLGWLFIGCFIAVMGFCLGSALVGMGIRP